MAMKGSAAWILAMNSSGKIVYWAGVTTTPISDGSTTNPVMINGSSVTIRPGGAVGYNGNEFVLSEDGIWQEFGETDVQHKTLDTPITVDGTEETTVEGALSAINEYAEDIDERDADAIHWDEAEGYVGKNLYNNIETGMASSAGSVTLNNNGGYTLKGTGQYTSSKNILKRCKEGKKYILSAKIISSDASDLRLGIRNLSNIFIESIVIGTTTGIYTVPFTYSNGCYAALTFNFSGTSSERTVVCEEMMVREEGTPSDYANFVPSNMELSESKADKSSLGTAASKNSTSVVTQSTDLVESGAVYDALGFGNKNLFDPNSNNKEWVAQDNQIVTVGTAKTVRVNCSEGDTLTLSNDNVATSESVMLIAFLDSQNNVLLRTPKASDDNFVTATAPSNTAYAICGFYTWSRVSNAQLEKGSTATTYEPYHPSVEETIPQVVSDAVGWDVSELLNITATSTTKNGVTFTVNADGSVSTSGTSNAEWIDFILNQSVSLKAGTYKLSGCNGGSLSTYRLVVYTPPAATNAILYDGETTFTLDFDTTVIVQITVRYSNVDMNGKVFKPSITHITVDEQKADNSVIGTVEDGATASKAYAAGDYFIKDAILGKAKAAIASGGTFTKDTNYEETNVAKEITELYKYIGILTTPVEAFTANSLPILKRNITNAFYNGSLRAEIAAGNFKNVRPGDYIIGQATGSIYYVVECDYWLGNGDSTNGTTYPAYNTHHLGLMLFKPVGTTALWRGYGYSDKSWRVSASDLGRCPWNAETTVDPTDTEAIGSNSTNITRSYNGTNMSAYMGSFIRERIDAILLPQCFQADFGSENVLKRRNWLSNAINASAASGARSDWQGIASGSVWVDRFIDLASEVELYGSKINSSSRDDIGVQNKQLPIYRNGRIHDFYPRMDLWTKGVASATFAAYRGNVGNAGTVSASYAFWACPLGCVK